MVHHKATVLYNLVPDALLGTPAQNRWSPQLPYHAQLIAVSLKGHRPWICASEYERFSSPVVKIVLRQVVIQAMSAGYESCPLLVWYRFTVCAL